MTDKLIPIPSKEWCNLRDLYLVDWPQNMLGYYTIDNFIKWISIDSNINNLWVYSLNGDWSDGTFIIIDRYQLFLNSLNKKSTERLKAALSLLDWSRGYQISTFLAKHHSTVIEVLDEKQLFRETKDTLTSVYFLPRSKASELQISVPDRITIKEMSQEDAMKANSVWPNRHEGTEFLLKRLVAWNPNAGAYDRDGNLLAWCFRLQAGPLGALQVDVNHKREGLGSSLCKVMAKKLAEINADTFACVNKKNFPSIKMFEKIGFTHVDDVYWIMAYPKEMFHWVD